MNKNIKKQNKFLKILLGIVIVAAFIIIAGLSVFSVTKVTVEGNKYYKEDDIKKILLDVKYPNNSLYLLYEYKYKKADNIPFVQSVEISLETSHHVKFRVYEKEIVGYVECLGINMFFDKDGMVVESSSENQQNVPKITGLSFDHVVLNQSFPVDDEEVFKTILDVTLVLQKYSLVPDKIKVSNIKNIILYFKDAKVKIGSSSNLNEKISNLSYIIDKVENMSGTLHMEEFNGDSKNITFEKNKK